MIQSITEASQLPDISRRGIVRRRPIVGGVDILGRRLRREFTRNAQTGEHARFCLRGELGHALVCFDDRLLILKRGFYAGTTFGSMAATIFYRDVTGIQVRMQLLSGWIEISSPSFQGSERKRARRAGARERDVFKQPNCVPIHRGQLGVYQSALTELRRLVAAAKVEHDHGGLLDRLERLGLLRAQGVLDEPEFLLLKSRLLDGRDGTGGALPA